MLIDIAQNIKKLREKNGMTQTELAYRLALSRNAVNSWEMGLSFPSLYNVVELSKIFHVSVDYLLGLKSEETINLTNLTEEQKKIIYELINVFSEKK